MEAGDPDSTTTERDGDWEFDNCDDTEWSFLDKHCPGHQHHPT